MRFGMIQRYYIRTVVGGHNIHSKTDPTSTLTVNMDSNGRLQKTLIYACIGRNLEKLRILQGRPIR